ncbi:MAG: UbiA family prenyltransferase [Deltaproteobacteria bacterium]|nr:UbiA family prenyltransferase [Deltaproteobacteria bacterium]
MDPQMVETSARPLCVDLDGTLVSTDCLWESLFLLGRQAPLAALSVPYWFLAGKATAKRRISDRVLPNPSTLPYRAELIERLKAEKAGGRKLYLVTASDQRIANVVAGHLGLFEEAIGSDGQRNLKGPAKATYLTERFGKGGFDYAGDSSADLPVWQAADRPWLVGASSSLVAAVKAAQPQAEVVVPRAGGRAKAIVKALRPHQWMKNLLLFVAAILGHVREPVAFGWLLVAFFAFSFTASSVYVLNDLLDLEQDRQHRSKRKRPFASGLLSIPTGLVLFPLVLGLGLFLGGFFLPWKFTVALLGYFALTTVYSFYLKRKLILDVLALGGLFTYRVLAGGLAVGVQVSFWLLAFSLFFFTGLAFVKRFSELIETQAKELDRVPGRNYWVSDLQIITSIGPACGLIAVLIFCLYMNSPEVLRLYPRPEALWLIVPVLIYWNTRVWFLAGRDQLHDDPVVFAIRDRNSYLAGLVAGLCILAATYG